jgi:GTP cyclohydrolase II
VAQIAQQGILVKRVMSTGAFVNSINRSYLHAKVSQHRHAINLDGDFQ